MSRPEENEAEATHRAIAIADQVRPQPGDSHGIRGENRMVSRDLNHKSLGESLLFLLEYGMLIIWKHKVMMMGLGCGLGLGLGLRLQDFGFES